MDIVLCCFAALQLRITGKRISVVISEVLHTPTPRRVRVVKMIGVGSMVLRAAFNLAFLIVQVWYQGTLKGKMSEWFRAVVAFLFYFILEDCVLFLFLGLIHAHLRKAEGKERVGTGEN